MTDDEREWRLVREEVLHGATAMAYDEVAAETAAAGGPRTVRVYQWLPSTLSLGYRQDPDVVDWAYCEENAVDVTRRPTGGGAIYHDTHGDISYSIVAPAEELPGDLMETYELLCEPVLAALRELGVDVDFAEREQPSVLEPSCYLRAVHPAHDVVAGDGRKIAGNAQYRRRDAVVQHGSISYQTNPERHLGCFADHDVGPADFAERVTSIEEAADPGGRPYDGEDVGPLDSLALGRDRSVRVLEEALADWCGAEEGEWTDEEREKAEARAEEKFRDDGWVREREPPR